MDEKSRTGGFDQRFPKLALLTANNRSWPVVARRHRPQSAKSGRSGESRQKRAGHLPVQPSAWLLGASMLPRSLIKDFSSLEHWPAVLRFT